MTITPKDLSVLVVGTEAAGVESVSRLIEAGIKKFTFLSDRLVEPDPVTPNRWLEGAIKGDFAASVLAEKVSSLYQGVQVEANIADPYELFKSTPEYFLAFSVVLAIALERPLELAIGALLFQAPPRVLLTCWTTEFMVKIRSQYVEHRVTDEPGNVVVRGVDLHPRPEMPTDEKLARLRKALSECIDYTSSPVWMSYFVTIASVSRTFERKMGYPAAHRPDPVCLTGEEGVAEEIARGIIAERDCLRVAGIKVDFEAIKLCCAGGFGVMPQTPVVLGAMLARETVKLLSSTGRPINGCPVDLIAFAALNFPGLV